MTPEQELYAERGTCITCWTTDLEKLSRLSRFGYNQELVDGRNGKTTMRKDTAPGWMLSDTLR